MIILKLNKSFSDQTKLYF